MTGGTARIRALCLMELRTLLRDRRTVMMSIVLPLLVMPLMLFGSNWMEQRRHRALEVRESSFAVIGPRAAEARALVERARTQPPTGERDTAALLVTERQVEDAAAALADGTLDFYIDARNVADVQAAIAQEASARPRRSSPDQDRDEADAGRLDVDDPGATPAPDLLALRLVFRADRDTSGSVATRVSDRLRDLRRTMRHDALASAGFALPADSVAAVLPTNLAREAQVAGLALGRIVTVLLLFFLLSGGAIVAQDALAGEKERGTLETLLTTAISRREIVAAKVLLVFGVALLITTIQVVNMLVYVGFGLIPTTRNLAAAVTPLMALGLFVMFLPLAALVAGVLVLVSGHARSHREAQLYFLPLMLGAAVPALAALLPDIRLRSAIVLVPIANISVGVKEILVGRVDWLMLPVAWLVTAAAAFYAMRMATKALSTERLIMPSTGDSAPTTAEARARVGQVATWFAVMWAVLLVTSLNLGADFDIRGQLLLNLVVIFLGGSLLFVRRFHLDARVVFSLRMPHPAAWLAVLIGVPSGLVTGIGMFRVSQYFVPVPREMLESFSQYLVPDTIPFWQLLPMMTILPGVCEELAFRGVLLHSLRQHYSPVRAAILVGIAFGLFHVSLFRLISTAYLGVILAGVTILTGSIYPAMAWHALNNGLGLAAGRFSLGLDTLEPITYAAAAALLAVSFWILWRTRVTVARTRPEVTTPPR